VLLGLLKRMCVHIYCLEKARLTLCVRYSSVAVRLSLSLSLSLYVCVHVLLACPLLLHAVCIGDACYDSQCTIDPSPSRISVCLQTHMSAGSLGCFTASLFCPMHSFTDVWMGCSPSVVRTFV